MVSELVYLSGYGQFVWPAFVFTYFSCLILYLKTRRDLKKYEKLFFKEFNQINEIETVREEKIAKKVVFDSSI
tara:strand:- start:350 stop:568 length:219 start_codon:yes stop_codon:yes gene_type:complete